MGLSYPAERGEGKLHNFVEMEFLILFIQVSFYGFTNDSNARACRMWRMPSWEFIMHGGEVGGSK